MKATRIQSFRDVVMRVTRNWPGYVPEFRVFLAVALLASLADMGSTICVIRLSGPEGEFHPVIRSMCEQMGPVVGPICGKAWQFLGLILLTLFLRKEARLIFVPTAISYTLAAGYNVWANGLLWP
jgi:hypothetical protein